MLIRAADQGQLAKCHTAGRIPFYPVSIMRTVTKPHAPLHKSTSPSTVPLQLESLCKAESIMARWYNCQAWGVEQLRRYALQMWWDLTAPMWQLDQPLLSLLSWIDSKCSPNVNNSCGTLMVSLKSLPSIIVHGLVKTTWRIWSVSFAMLSAKTSPLNDDKENPQGVWNAAAHHHDDPRRVTV